MSYQPIAIVGICGALIVAGSLVGALALSGHSEALASPSVVLVLGFCSLVITSLLGFGAIHTQGQELHTQLNSRLDELVASKTAQARTAGYAEGQAAGPDRSQ